MDRKELTAKEQLPISLEDIRRYIAPNATEKELYMFVGIAKAYGLNPLKREIHFVKYGNSPGQVIVGYETYIKRAERTGKLDGWKVWIEKDDIGEKAVIEIYRKDFSYPFRWEVYRNEFDRKQSTWNTMRTFMLKKVAIAQGFRLAFPDDLGGMPYIPEELPTEVTGNTTSESLDRDEIVQTNGDEPLPDMPEEKPSQSDVQSTQAQHRAIFHLLGKLGIKDELAQHEKVTELAGIDGETITSMSALTKEQASRVIKALNQEVMS